MASPVLWWVVRPGMRMRVGEGWGEGEGQGAVQATGEGRKGHATHGGAWTAKRNGWMDGGMDGGVAEPMLDGIACESRAVC